MGEWNAGQYLKFEDERTRPARDLLAQVPLDRASHAVDLGCGPGNSTELLAVRFPEARVTGVDNAGDMLASARKRLPHINFVDGDISTWETPDKPDLIFANAVFQWVPDHEALLPRLVAQLAPGGVLAIQMPDNKSEPVHVLMRETAASGPWAGKLADAAGARTDLATVGWYYDLLRPVCGHVDIWHTIYNHPLADVPAIVEWVKGTGLRPFIDPLDPAEKATFLADYEARLRAVYAPRGDGKVLLPFPRQFIVAVKV